MEKMLELAVSLVKERDEFRRMNVSEVMDELRRVYGNMLQLTSMDASSVISAIESAKGTGVDPSTVENKGIGDDFVTCLECGQKFRQLTYKHLLEHNLTVDAYKQKYGIPRRQSLSSLNLSSKRSEMCKARGIPENLRAYLESRSRRSKSKNEEEGGETKMVSIVDLTKNE